MKPDLIIVLVIAALALAAWTVVRGFGNMTQLDENEHARSNALMWQRIGWQALAFLFVLIAMLVPQLN